MLLSSPASPRMRAVAGPAKLRRYLRASPAQCFVSQQPVDMGVLLEELHPPLLNLVSGFPDGKLLLPSPS